MDLKRQASAPLYEALERFRKARIVPFDVPGHKRGRGNPELVRRSVCFIRKQRRLTTWNCGAGR